MLTSGQHERLRARFKFYSEDAGNQIADATQPEDGLVDGYPGIVLKNRVVWFDHREARPKDGAMKTKAPQTPRYPLVLGDPDAKSVLVVEGEGDGIAAYSVDPGATVIVAGGTNTLLGDDLARARLELFKGREALIAFDPDEPGRKGAAALAAMLLEETQGDVAVKLVRDLELDLEDWLGTFETREDARHALEQAVTGLEKTTKKTLAKEEKERKAKEVTDLSARLFVPGDPQPRLLVTTYERATGRIGLAYYGPLEEPEKAVRGYGDVQVDWENVARGWKTPELVEHGGLTYRPDTSQAMATWLRDHVLSLPPPPGDAPSSAELWIRVRDFIQRWLVLRPVYYDGLTAGVFLSWRLRDADFAICPYFRFHGPPGTGKSRGLDVMQELLWRSYAGQPTPGNIHRVMGGNADISLVMDETDFSGPDKDGMLRLLRLGSQRSRGSQVRMEKSASGKMEAKLFDSFGLKVFAGYSPDEEGGMARRTIAIHMERGAEGAATRLPQPPERFYVEGEELRRQLLAWRATRLGLGTPDPEGPEAQEIYEHVPGSVAQAFYPLLTMVPTSLPEARANLLEMARIAGQDHEQLRRRTADTILLEAFLETSRVAGTWKDGIYYVTAAELAVNLDRTWTVELVGKIAHGLGIQKRKLSVGGSRARRFVIPDGKLFEEHGLAWTVPAEEGEEPGL